MKTKLFSSLTTVLFTIVANAQITTFPWTETFEDSSPTRAGWTQVYEVNNMSWTYSTTASTGSSGVTAYDGTKFANYPGTSHNFDKTKLVSPALNLTGVTNPTVSFFYINPYWNPDQNWLRVFFRISATDPWVQIAEFHSNITTWTSSGSMAIPPNTYQIAVECETDYGYSTLVDGLVVTGTNLSVSDAVKTSKSTIKYFPNPAEDVLNYESKEKVYEISVYNNVGQKVLDHKVESNQGKINVSSLVSGTYLVRTKTDSGINSFKMIKK
ncbi:T9SS type A sorting domain-containing protein [Chryseobacterium chendengshani]|uniref:T9SS type A sorting domain-containing protein n=1 Tax=Chryseobacterium sp. LJ668 TaxID=2864040 RepID=UPI001C68DDFC|nr:T9SS type A sorting domain-containing protein [Chryseobacterium sp. LJ668]MBW8523579.1 T9SS type A sorting domain-containing protein [Chryseobacterium sp. LJ668]QYK15862.1 T9SS type A sorting domain-containing protein [Chryseobacterium sp. LJ668]